MAWGGRRGYSSRRDLGCHSEQGRKAPEAVSFRAEAPSGAAVEPCPEERKRRSESRFSR